MKKEGIGKVNKIKKGWKCEKESQKYPKQMQCKDKGKGGEARKGGLFGMWIFGMLQVEI